MPYHGDYTLQICYTVYDTNNEKNEGQIGLYIHNVLSISCDIILTLNGLWLVKSKYSKQPLK